MEKEKNVVQKKETKSQGVEQTKNALSFSPYTDILEDKDGLTVIMDMPGTVEKEIDIHLDNDVLTVSGKALPEFKDGQLLSREYNVGDYQRSFRLVDDFEAEKISATFKNGVLTIRLPKAEQAKPRKITIKS